MRHFLQLEDWSSDEIRALLDDAVALKKELREGGNRPLLKGKTLAMIFQKPSLRTRTSFEMGMVQLGGHAIYLGPNEIGLGKRESIADVVRVLSGYVDGIMARVFDHEHVFEMAKWGSVPIINGLSDARHPCQAMADMLTIYEHFGHFEGLKLAYIGDGNNVAASLLLASAHLGIQFVTATPPAYRVAESAVKAAESFMQHSGATFTQVEHPQDAARDADILYTDTWISMGQEAEAEERLAVFQAYQINTDLLKHAKPSAVVMHDLPAYRGKEITDDVADGAQSVIFQQAHNRLHAQKAVLAKLLVG